MCIRDRNITYVKDNDKKNVAKPKYYFKALAQKVGNTYYTIGFKMNNKAPSNTDYLSLIHIFCTECGL